jgi:Abnormal spindle-like microcephaly-assoc'd, ASPM-SPD-2-Hydin
MAVAALPWAGGPAEAAIGTSPIVGPQGFPQWYEDADGQRVEICLDSINCAPGSEAVYWAASAAPPAGLTGQGLEMEVTGSFDPASGQFVVTGRIRIRVRDLVPGEQYTFTYPYGQAVATADLDPNPLDPEDQTGRVKYIEEVGCTVPEVPDGTPLPPAPPCDFASPLAGPLFEGFLRQQGAPAGFLGEGLLAVTPRPVVNGPQGNAFQVEDQNGAPVAGPPTRDFLVEGRLAAPVTASMGTTDFGLQKVGSPVTRTVTVQNTDTQALTMDPPEVTGPNADDFTLGPAVTGGCGTDPLAAGATCRLRLTFQPQGAGSRTATLSFPNDRDGANLVRSLTVTGTGALPRAVIPTALHFGSVGVGQRKTLPLTISNRSNVDLVVGSVQRTGSPEFAASTGTCTAAPVRARRSCVIDVTYRPSGIGQDAATLAVSHDAADSPTTVTLSAQGVDATAPSISTLRVRPGRFHPSGGSASVAVGLDGPGRATVQVLRRHHVIRNLGVLRFDSAGNRATRWNGRDDRGGVVDPGTYLIRVTARDPAGNASARSTRIRVLR